MILRFVLALSAVLAAGAALAGPVTPPPAIAAPTAQGDELLMVDRIGCVYCARFKAEILPSYAATTTGQRVPLRIVQIDGPWPDGLALARRPALTPTFVLLRDGTEVGRVEGYPGADWFWPVVEDMLAKAGPAPVKG